MKTIEASSWVRIDDTSFVVDLGENVRLCYFAIEPKTKRGSTKHQIVLEGPKPVFLEDKVQPWYSGVPKWDKAPVSLGIKPKVWEALRSSLREALEKMNEQREKEREEAYKIKEDELIEKLRLEREAKEKELDKYYEEHPDEVRQAELPENNLCEPEERPSYYGLHEEDLSKTVMRGPFLETEASPTKAAQNIFERVPLCLRKCNKGFIYVRNEGRLTWSDQGIIEIERTADVVLGDLSDQKFIKELTRRVKDRLILDQSFVDFEEKYHGLIGLQDGLVADLETREVRAMTVEDHVLAKHVLPIHYKKDAKCPAILMFFKDVLVSEASIRTLLDTLVAILDRRAWRVILIMVGKGLNGKSIMVQLLQKFIGDDSVLPLSLKEVEGRFNLANVLDMRLVIISEGHSEKRDSRKVPVQTEKMKAMSGRDFMNGEMKNVQEHVKFVPFAVMVMNSNDPMLFDDNTPAWLSRMRPLIFPNTFLYQEEIDKLSPSECTENIKLRDDNILAKLTTDEELSGLLNLLLERAPALMQTSTVFKDPNAMEIFQGQVNPLLEFTNRFVKKLDMGEQGASVSANHLLLKYKRYCQILNMEPKGDRSFYRYLSTLSGRESQNITVLELQEDGTPKEKRVKGYVNLVFDEKGFADMENTNKECMIA